MGPLATLCPTWLDAENSRLLWVPVPPNQRCPVSSGKQVDGMWFWCLRGHSHPPPGCGRQPSVIGSAASKLQEADLKGDQSPGGGAHGHSGQQMCWKPTKEVWQLQTQRNQRTVVFN